MLETKSKSNHLRSYPVLSCSIGAFFHFFESTVYDKFAAKTCMEFGLKQDEKILRRIQTLQGSSLRGQKMHNCLEIFLAHSFVW